ncbi:hypothetical protein JN01_0596 [Entomoplasma freundtii]|uniref:Malate permease n=1 Tax=Entomoplasma freundtii TaxID=74700 RepID=A0A2K8NUR0_9MOLU|nr:AEC family transporter [Entomoplasma freundtii]ATZ16363.1 malate permease [Entomoplasma freundtii]TDY56598.1 hypothetical protein JN01_0596 [Entomoplasma freundtii]
MSSLEVLKITLSNTKFWGTIIVAALVISLGYFLEKRHIMPDKWEKVIVKITLFIGLPAMILKNFMVDLDTQNFNNLLVLLIIGFLAYILLTLLGRLVFIKYQAKAQDALIMCAVCPSVLYFGFPMAEALANSNQQEVLKQATNFFNIAFWFYLSWYSLYVYQRPHFATIQSKQERRQLSRKIAKSLLKNPIMIALIGGLVLWLMQMIPGIKIIHVTDNGWNTISPGNYSVTRLDALIPGFNQAVTILGALPTPLAWLSIGILIARSPLLEALKDKAAWLASSFKMLIVPLVTVGLFVFFAWFGQITNLYEIPKIALIVSILMMASPTATAMASYAILYQKEAQRSAKICTQTTFLALITMPFWAVITSLIGETNLFQ